MSHITKKRFQNKNRCRKAEISKGFADAIYNELSACQKPQGIPVISCTGPNVRAHLKEYDRLISNRNLHVIENNPGIYDLIVQDIKLSNDHRAKHKFGDVMELADRVLHGRAKRAYFDFDLCRTFLTLEEEGFLNKLCDLSLRLRGRLECGWMSFTFCLRNGVHETSEIIDELKWAWCGDMDLMNFATYADGAPMATFLFRIK
ncbi:hypothetical protein LCGC14_2142720 [marine sediment metagenome]|uniref:Uncharacterized protein n=1 Tax=marine sediment metagenome TaxID=412755 RepID=A0A0F9DY54_9ZZZZ